MGPMTLFLHPLHFPRGALQCVIIIQRIGLPGLLRGMYYSFGTLLFETFQEHIHNYLTTPGMGRWGLIASTLPQCHSNMDSIACLILMYAVILSMLRCQRSFARWLAGLQKSEGHLRRNAQPWHAFLQWIHIIPQVLSCSTCVISFNLYEMRKLGEVLFWVSAPLE